MNIIYDEDFLNELARKHDRELWVRLVAIGKHKNPLYSLEGKTIGGSVNIDGASAVRRTCSLTFVPTEGIEDMRNFYWGLNTRFTLEIGLTISPIENPITNKANIINHAFLNRDLNIFISPNSSYLHLQQLPLIFL